MNPRERYIQTMTFGTPDKIPFEPGWPRESTIANWRTGGLGEGVKWRDRIYELLDIQPDVTQEKVSLGVNYRMIPQFEEKVIEHKDGHYVVQDWKGNICEISDKYDLSYLRHAKDFVTRRWIKCPVENRDDWEAMKERYKLDTPGRFPDDFEQRCKRAAGRDYSLSFNGIPGPFWMMREWCGFENMCIMTIEQPDLIADMAGFWCEFVAQIIERILKSVVPDVLNFNEDMAYKAKAMISPTMMREFCMPSYKRWTGLCRAAGMKLADCDSDGYVGEIIPIWIESGVNVCNPMEVAAHNDINEYRRIYGEAMAYHGGIDKRAMAKGGETLKAEMKRIEPVVRSGGYIPSCDHGVPADVSWPNFVDYCTQLAHMTGWK